MLRTDTGARQVILATAEGELLYLAGSQPDFDLGQVVAAMAASVNSSFRVATELSQEKPLAIQFLSGETSDVYFTNIDRSYFVAIFIDAQARRGRIGTIWLFAQRAVRDIRQLIPDMQKMAIKHAGQTQELVLSDLETVESVDALLSLPEQEKEEPPAAEGATIDTAQEQERQPPIDVADSEVASTVEEPRPDPLADVRLESLLANMTGDQPADQPDDHMDAFWNDALASDLENASPGLSLDEARDQGLIGPDFDIEEG